MRILIVEDEEQIAKPIKSYLERRSFAVDYANNGTDGYDMASFNEYDCIILDLNLPGIDGIEVANKLRKDNIQTPILMLTARNSQKDIWKGFENGTDDYLTKPFDLKELLLRINALIKRNSYNKEEILSAGNITLNVNSFEVTVDNKIIKLNNKEFGILEYLLRNKGIVVSSEQLLEHVWDREIDMLTQTVKTNLKTLRKKVDPNKKLIQTIKGKGYVIR